MPNYQNKEEVMKYLQKQFIEAENMFEDQDILGIFCCGSQNYGLATPESDLDAKCIIIPRVEDFIFNYKPTSFTCKINNGNQIDFKDIRLYFNLFRKQNLNFLEILFTDYYYINPKYKEEWEEFLKHREKVAHYWPTRLLKATQGNAWNAHKRTLNPTEDTQEIFDKYGYNPKQLMNLFRFYEYIQKYINGKPFKECMVPDDLNELIDIKTGKYSAEWAKTLADKLISDINIFCENYYDKNPLDGPSTGTMLLLNNTQKNIIMKYLKSAV